MRKLPLFLLVLCCLRTSAYAAEKDNIMMGSVVKSDKWKMDRTKDQEFFDGNVSFRNPHYTLTADHALYKRKEQAWDINGSVYTLRRLEDKSQVEAYCDRARYLETEEKAFMERGKLPVRMIYTGTDGKKLRSRSDHARAENKQGLMYFNDNFALSTENLDIYSMKGLYNNIARSFLIEKSTPLAVGTREGYNFAINSERIMFFRDSRDIKFYNNVSGWVKDPPEGVKK